MHTAGKGWILLLTLSWAWHEIDCGFVHGVSPVVVQAYCSYWQLTLVRWNTSFEAQLVCRQTSKATNMLP